MRIDMNLLESTACESKLRTLGIRLYVCSQAKAHVWATQLCRMCRTARVK